MSAMARPALPKILFAAILPCVLLSVQLLSFQRRAQAQDITQQLRDQYQGKPFVLRGFYSSDRLLFDSSGKPDNATTGDWTTNGFVRINDIHFSDDRIVIKAQRLVAAWVGETQTDQKRFELLPLENRSLIGKKFAVLVKIEADSGMHNPAPEQVEALLSKIFLTSQDSFADMVPDYWKHCVAGGSTGSDKVCVFSPEILAVPGVSSASAVSMNEGAPAPVLTGVESSHGRIFKVGQGVSPPRAIYQPNPEFSDQARVAKFQGVVMLMLVVDDKGTATNVRILQPLGYGLDEKAVQAVSGWKFKPAEKDGQPVAAEIAVEVSFHLY
jgi:TonB family protein